MREAACVFGACGTLTFFFLEPPWACDCRKSMSLVCCVMVPSIFTFSWE